MKLIINTQIRENYAAHNSDYVAGVSQDYWKFKGGNTYVVRDLKESHVVKINVDGIPALTKLIEERNEHFEEYILDYEIVDDSAKECEEWEAPIEFVWGGDRWLCRREKFAGEFDCWADDIQLKEESWIPLEGGERFDYECRYYDSKYRLVEVA